MCIISATPLVGPACVARSISDPRITVAGKSSESGPSFASATEMWGSFSYAGDGQPLPTMSLTAAGDGFELSGKLVEPLTNNYQGIGLYFNRGPNQA